MFDANWDEIAGYNITIIYAGDYSTEKIQALDFEVTENWLLYSTVVENVYININRIAKIKISQIKISKP